ncbi:MAG: glutamate--tRNA ligase [Zetaproteobacteria bacterium]|nr:MAG: glutamate--tRNA ligase [Zetaproteobacteria bacterium]
MTIRTRFAPSPTGMLHIGGARTALFSWLHARHHKGEFVLRIEDTDRERSTEEATQVILDGLAWLGLDWDGDVIFQSRNHAAHVAAVECLINAGKAYRCYCSKDELDAMRDAQRAAGQKPMYDGRCRHRADEPVDQPHVIRFRSPDAGETMVRDLVLGDVTFDNRELDDLILMRSDGSPTYNLAVVVDDADMDITHVIRGSDHLNNTPRQIQLYEALGLSAPEFAHIPLIHGPDGAKMSKRHGAIAITQYREAGYLADAVVNYLARLGWSHGDEEVFSRQQLVELFDVRKVGKAAARFDQNKLDWLNAHYLRCATPEALATEVMQQLDVDVSGGPDIVKVIQLLQERSKNLIELAEGARFFYAAPVEYVEKAVKKNFKETTWPLLDVFVKRADLMEEWTAESVHALISNICEAEGVNMGKLAQPIRILVSGGPVSPPIDATLVLLGKDESLQRIKQGIKQLSSSFT